MSVTRDRQSKPAPPRVSDEFRRSEFMRQTGLRSEGSAKMRRRLAALVRTNRPNHAHRPA
jgi:hypothetical protein